MPSIGNLRFYVIERMCHLNFSYIYNEGIIVDDMVIQIENKILYLKSTIFIISNSSSLAAFVDRIYDFNIVISWFLWSDVSLRQ